MHVDDLADACLFLMDHYDEEQTINVGTGEDLTIGELAGTGARRRLPRGRDRVRYDQARRHAAEAARRLPAARPRLAARIELREGIASAYEWFCDRQPVVAS